MSVPQTHKPSLTPNTLKALVLALYILALSIEYTSFPETPADTGVFSVIKFAVTLSLAVMVISAIKWPIVPPELPVTVL